MAELFDALSSVLHKLEIYHDTYTLVHEENTGKMMKCLAKSLGYKEKYCNELEQMGNIHDIGKLVIPSEILDKPAKLNLFERDIIEKHSLIGHKLLEGIDHPLAKRAATINLYHHEAYDGSGYPVGLKAENIPIEARICTLCDVYDAMRANRPYHPRVTTHKIIVQQMLSKKTNGLFYKFDPRLLEVFESIHEEFDKIFCSS